MRLDFTLLRSSSAVPQSPTQSYTKLPRSLSIDCRSECGCKHLRYTEPMRLARSTFSNADPRHARCIASEHMVPSSAQGACVVDSREALYGVLTH